REESRRFWRSLYGAMLAHWGIDDSSGAIFDVLYGRFTSYESYRLFPDVIPTLTACRAAGLTLGIVSNFEAWLEGMLIEMEVAPFFAFMVISGKEGVEKPDPAIFRLALERSGVAPEEAVFVGDHPRLDVEAASQLGMTGVLIDRLGRYDDFEGLRVRALTDLLPIVGAALTK
ncbi:MAG TPA: HAD-IA family hydrolase, partial [Actinomycetota bacterium]|nr:HAD-IA family hydrolase [Actinomycetota bacterium]